MKRITGGTARYSRGKLYFNDEGWAIIKAVAKRTKKSPKVLVMQAIKRYIKWRSK